MDQFTRGFLEAAFAIGTDDDDAPLDENYSISDLAPVALQKIVADCKKFQDDNAELLGEDILRIQLRQCTELEYAGHDFYLTRNHSGAGFWDGDWEAAAGKTLTEAAHKFGEFSLYVGDDGKIYSYPQ